MKKPCKILFVDDETSLCKLCQLCLTRFGFTVEIATSGTEALILAQDFLPDLILLDVTMPDMDGPTLLRELRAVPKLKRVPVAWVTAWEPRGDDNDIRNLGVVGTIAKPFDLQTLRNQVERLLQESHAA